MESENFISLPDSGDSVIENAGHESDVQYEVKENGEILGHEGDVQYEVKENREILGHESDVQCEVQANSEKLRHESGVQYEVSHCMLESNLEKELVDGDSDMEIEDINNLPVLNSSRSANEEIKLVGNKKGNAHFIQSETVAVAGESNVLFPKVHENGCLPVQDSRTLEVHKKGGTSISGVKRARMTVDEQQASVRVTFDSLTRASKQKLEELLQQWSEWHAKHVSSSQDSIEVVESGEETFFPALHVGIEKTSAVYFWMDNQTQKADNNESNLLDNKDVPLYDRGYALGLTLAGSSINAEGGLEIIDDASRCFNCGSYSHSLKNCPKPRNHAAVNSARKQLKSKRNQNANSRNPTRYYQDSPAGKYDGLRPGVLDSETRKLLGLGEFDPPPWLNRMREIGYPPGYLDVDDEDQPSGIIIYADGEIKEEQEDGEIVQTDYADPERKKTVEFPGVNAPVPENADERLWAPGHSIGDLSRNRSHSRISHHSEPVSRGHHREQRWSRDYRDDGPPGVDPGFAPSSYPPRYGSYDYGYNSHSSSASAPRSPTFGRSQSDRDRRISSFNEGSFPYSNSRHSPKDYGAGNTESWNDESRNDYDLDNSSYSRDRLDRYRHHRWR